MTISSTMMEKLKRAFNATRIAVVGASQDQHSVGIGPLINLLGSSFQGDIFPVNPKYETLLGKKCYPSLEAIDPPPDLAILLLNQNLALKMAEEAAQLGIGAVTIVAGGFKEVGAGGKELEESLKALAEHYQMPVIGPNTLGISSFHHGMHSIFWHLDTFPGPVAVISQSGGVGTALGQCLRSLQCGLSHFVGAGNCSVVDFGDYLEALSDDPAVRTFCLFIEGLHAPRAFYEAAGKVAARKPVVVYKAGKHEEVSRATATHTGSLTGEYDLYRSMFRQAGLVEVQSTWEAAVSAKALSMLQLPGGNRLCALTFTAGPSIVAMDMLIGNGWKLPDLSPATKEAVRKIIGEKTAVATQNPVDLTGPGFLPHVYSRVLQALTAEDYDAYFLVWNYNRQIRLPLPELEQLQRTVTKPMVLVLLANPFEVRPHLEECAAKGICAYLTPEDGAMALNALLNRRRMCDR
ncbi:acetate--CoA ligase family protein [Desulfoferrobacter suflitae]|uniref:acetate--CoA ligase family protein n=1 Tax=Desulfoferrobacter suflitae TaxID=2865782 RepID=UPI0021647979|nr:CoA-binding protein [Desulfoferrobacter suflitae]MCK8601375.1 CoA-binding protein [Desulfoferrobacter suflitae]